MKRFIVWLALLLPLIILHPAQAAGTENTSVPRFEPDRCAFFNLTGIKIDCGWLIVPENHADPTGKTIRLAVAIVRASSSQQQPDPLFYVAGGPGGGVVWQVPLMAAKAAAAQTQRDTVYMDQRGMGLSEPLLICPAITEERLASDPQIERLVRECRATLAAQGIHTEYYTTAQIAADFAALRVALGYDQVNLIASSYGTRVALTILRDHPAGIRSAALDSIMPPQINMYEEASAAFDRAFRRMEAQCAADLICRTAYPEPRKVYQELFRRLNQSPISILKKGKTFRIDGITFEGLVMQRSYSPEGLASLPALISSTASGDYSMLTGSLDLEPVPPKGGEPSKGASLSIMCGEDGAATTFERVRARAADYDEAFRQPLPIVGEHGLRLCEAWGMKPAPQPKNPITTIPVLLMAGENDPATPPEWAELAAQTLPNSHLIRFPYLGHPVSANSCGAEVAARFLNDPTRRPDTACIQNIQASPVILSASATRPALQVAALALLAVALWTIILVGRALLRHPRGIAWGASFRKGGVIPLLISAAFILLVISGTGEQLFQTNRARMVETIIPLIMAIQAALAFSPEDEPALEVQLAAPRPVVWTLLERFAVIALTQTGIALVGTVLSLALTPGQDAVVMLLGWLPPALFLSGIGIYITLRTRTPLFSVLVIGLLWFGFSMFGDFFLPGRSFAFPLNVIQPFLWSIHAYLQPVDLGAAAYWLNRLTLAGAGIGLMVLAVGQLRSEESLLMNADRGTRKRRQRQITQAAEELPLETEPPVTGRLQWRTLAVSVNPLRQMLGIAWVEFKMQWRRRPLRVMTVTMLIGMLASAFVFSALLSSGSFYLTSGAGTSPEQSRHMNTLIVILNVWVVIGALASFILPVAVADTIPNERQQGAAELLASLPISNPVYLIGKVLGVLLALGASMAAAMCFGILIWWAKIGPFDLLAYLDLWIVGAGGVAVLNAALAVLLGATQPTRLRVLLLMIALFVVPSMIFPTSTYDSSIWAYINPIRSPIMNHYLNLFGEGILNPGKLTIDSALTSREVALTLFVGSLQVVLAALVAWGWRNWQQKRI